MANFQRLRQRLGCSRSDHRTGHSRGIGGPVMLVFLRNGSISENIIALDRL